MSQKKILGHEEGLKTKIREDSKEQSDPSKTMPHRAVQVMAQPRTLHLETGQRKRRRMCGRTAGGVGRGGVGR